MLRKLPVGLLLYVTAALFSIQAFAQNRPVSGQIRDENGPGMSGVNVLLKGTNRGTNSNAEGNFSIDVPAGASTLIISSVGCDTKEVPVSPSTTTPTIDLNADVRNLYEWL